MLKKYSELAKKKQQQVIKKREKAAIAKSKKDEAKKKAAAKKALSKEKKLNQEQEKIKKAAKKETKKANKSDKTCYICKADFFDDVNKKKWLTCEEFAHWCCFECLPLAFKSPDITPKSYFCNDCV